MDGVSQAGEEYVHLVLRDMRLLGRTYVLDQCLQSEAQVRAQFEPRVHRLEEWAERTREHLVHMNESIDQRDQSIEQYCRDFDRMCQERFLAFSVQLQQF